MIIGLLAFILGIILIAIGIIVVACCFVKADVPLPIALLTYLLGRMSR